MILLIRIKVDSQLKHTKYIGRGNSRQKENTWGKEKGKWLAEDTTALWCDHSTSYWVLLLLYGRIFDLHRNGICAKIVGGQKKIIMNRMKRNNKKTCRLFAY